jgi:hypothetical protein
MKISNGLGGLGGHEDFASQIVLGLGMRGFPVHFEHVVCMPGVWCLITCRSNLGYIFCLWCSFSVESYS